MASLWVCTTRQEAVAIDIVVFLASHYAKHGPKLANAGAIHLAVGMPRRFSEPAMQKLSRAGIIFSKRGPVGGYHFCGRPDVTIADILRAVGDHHSKAPGGKPSRFAVEYLNDRAAEITVGQIQEMMVHGG